MKVIFLDVDGVIAPFRRTGVIEDEKLELLKGLVEETDSKIVLSSSWRLYKEETDDVLNLYTYLLGKLKEFDLYIYDTTPIKFAKSLTKERITPKGTKIVNYYYDPYSIRSREIKEWLDKNEVDSFVILDDEDYNYKYFSLDNNFVKTNPYQGLEKEDIEEAKEVLGKDKIKKR